MKEKNNWSTPAVIAISGIWFLFGMAAWKWGYVLWRMMG